MEPKPISIFTKDELFIINEFKNLKLNCLEIKESFQSSINSIIDIYLKPNNYLLNFKNKFDRNHPLSEYSLNVLVQFEIGYNYWKNSQFLNFESLIDYCNKLNDIETKLVNLESSSSSSSSILNNEKDELFSNINNQFIEKVKKFDNSIILIQLSIPQLLQFLSNLHSNSSEILLKKPINYKNPIDATTTTTINNNNNNNLFSSLFTYFQNNTTQQQKQQIQQQLEQQLLQLKKTKEIQDNQSKQLLESDQYKSILTNLLSNDLVKKALLFLNPPTLNQLVDDHLTHQKLWDSKIWIKKKIYTQTVKSELVEIIKFKQPCSLLWVKFWMPVPPTYQNQTIKSSSFTLHDIETDQLLYDSQIVDKNAFQPISIISIVKPKTTSFKLKYKIEADIYKCETKSITKEEADALKFQVNKNNNISTSTIDPTIINFETISEIEKKLYKRSTSKMNYSTPEFKSFIEKYELYRKEIPTINSSSSNVTNLESILSFAYRVSIFLKLKLKYIYPAPGNTEALNTFENGGGDCGCLSHLASAILRFNNIPTRLLYGIISTEPRPIEVRHAKLEFYNQDIGIWFQYDPSDITTLDPYRREYFANDKVGNFITHHLDPFTDIPVLNSKEIDESVFQTCSMKYFYLLLQPTPQFELKTIDFTLKKEILK